MRGPDEPRETRSLDIESLREHEFRIPATGRIRRERTPRVRSADVRRAKRKVARATRKRNR